MSRRASDGWADRCMEAACRCTSGGWTGVEQVDGRVSGKTDIDERVVGRRAMDKWTDECVGGAGR